MANIEILAKDNGQIIQSLNADSVVLNQNSIVKVGAKIEDVANITREGNAAIITLKNGEKIVVENYFDPAVNESLLAFEGNNGELYWAEFTDSSGQLLDVIKYNPITEEALLGGAASELLPWIGGAIAVGGIAAAASSGGSSNNGGGSPVTNPVDAAEALIKDAEDKQKAAEDLLNELQKDGLITPEEQAQIQDAVDAAAAAKDKAQDAVNALPDGSDKDRLQDRLDDLNDPIIVPPVNDADADGVEDTVEEQAATALVEEAEAAQKAAEDLLAELQEDGLITPAEQAQLQAAADAAAEAKSVAEAAVNDLTAGGVRDALEGRLDVLTPITIPPVNDANENGIDDSTENPLDLSNDLVDAAEAAYQAAEDALADAITDGLITPEEQAALEDALADAQDAKDLAQGAVNALPVGTERDGLQDRLDALIDIVVPPITPSNIDAFDDEFELDLGQETRLERNEITAENVAILDILGGNISTTTFTVPEGATSNISVTVQQDNLISIGEAVQVVIYQQTENGSVEVARGNAQAGVVTVGGVNLLGVVGDNNSITLNLSDLPEGDYVVAVEAYDSVLTSLVKEIAISDLGGEGAILGASNQAAILGAINTVLGDNLVSQALTTTVAAILLPVNVIGLPLSSVVNELLDALPTNVLDYIVDQAVAPLLSNLLTAYERVDIRINGTDEVFANYEVKGNIFADNSNGADILDGATVTEIDGQLVTDPVIIEGEYGNLEIDPVTGEFTYTVTVGEAAIGQTEIFDYTLSNGISSDSAQLKIEISGIPADPSDLLLADYIDQIVANVSGESNDSFTGSLGADTVIYNVLEGAETDATGGNGTDIWTDFSLTEGDDIDVSALLTDTTAENIDEYISVEVSDNNTMISVDHDGAGTQFQDKVELITFEGVNTNLEELLSNGHIIY
ncbi:hypothetical protein BS636_08430 [Acinetobacter sp. LoGeW2-3]|uniref:GA-like domain-containing protein n=1 Tax=Acinetobacter sp. LoGeW2-3 TaxID=1808001 RepID=UPI000C05CBAF|nr:BapA prefix-like domain-containing protein [Acinetobacter sp. LoGeW2-3]ATO19676.1 hypothetical protein BS636_08430 [Acinetobacter sp. LoGeW2-3]